MTTDDPLMLWNIRKASAGPGVGGVLLQPQERIVEAGDVLVGLVEIEGSSSDRSNPDIGDGSSRSDQSPCAGRARA